MVISETRVDLQHLLEDLRDVYPGALEEAILTDVDQTGFEKHAPGTFAALAASFTDYKL